MITEFEETGAMAGNTSLVTWGHVISCIIVRNNYSIQVLELETGYILVSMLCMHYFKLTAG